MFRLCETGVLIYEAFFILSCEGGFTGWPGQIFIYGFDGCGRRAATGRMGKATRAHHGFAVMVLVGVVMDGTMIKPPLQGVRLNRCRQGGVMFFRFRFR
jgi:hypothetical protein